MVAMDVTLLVLHDPPTDDLPPLTRLLAEARHRLADEQEQRFRQAGVARVLRLPGRGSAGTPVGSFGEYLASIVAAERPTSLIVMSSGAVPRLTTRDARRLVTVAAADEPKALTNNRYSSDIIAVARAAVLADLPPLPSDNALPRWLEEHAGYAVADLPGRDRLTLDLDSPLDIGLWALARDSPAWAREVVHAHQLAVPRTDDLQALARDPKRELLVFGRAGSRTLQWLERNVRCRVRFLAEERGLRASSPLAIGGENETAGGRGPIRPPHATLGRLLGHRGPEALRSIVEELADGAILDTRVLMADRLGADEDRWPSPEDRYASDLLRADRVVDPWLRTLTDAASRAAVPIALGGHTLVGPGISLLLASPAGAPAGRQS